MSLGGAQTGLTARWYRAVEVEMQTEEFRPLMGLLDTLSAEQRAQLQLQSMARRLAGGDEDHQGAPGAAAVLSALRREQGGR